MKLIFLTVYITCRAEFCTFENRFLTQHELFKCPMKIAARILFIFGFFTIRFNTSVFAQSHLVSAKVEKAFQEAYSNHPAIPKGLLEAVSYTNTRFKVIDPKKINSCAKIPIPTGIMGLFEDGKGYFSNNLQEVALASGKSVADIKKNVSIEIEAYAETLDKIAQHYPGSNTFVRYFNAVGTLDAMPVVSGSLISKYIKNTFLYQVYWFLKQTQFQQAFGFSAPNFNPIHYFGSENFKVLSSSYVTLSKEEISANGANFTQEKAGTDYPLALSVPAASCNYSSRSGTAISAVTIHTIQGTYASCISWFQNCAASVSAHYIVRSSDGQITQMVNEADKAWHVGTENSYTIGIEHEGFVADSTWYTNAMYSSSADLVRDICNSGYGISPLRTAYFPWASTTLYANASIPGSCIKIKGHQHFPNQTHIDPGQYWNWDLYYKLINNSTPVELDTNRVGTIFDSGNSSGDYSNDERKIYTIHPNHVHDLKINFTTFSIENLWDYLYIYDGTDVFAPLIGVYTGSNSPGSIVSNSGAFTIEFRSDCATTDSGYVFNWTSKPDLYSETILSSLANSMASIENYNKAEFKIYPSPCSNSFTIEQNENQVFQASLFNIAGKNVLNFKFKALKNKIDVSELQSGIYFLKIKNDKQEKTIKLLKK